MCHGISIRYPYGKGQNELSNKPCAAAVRQGKQTTNKEGVSLCSTLNLERTDHVVKPESHVKFLKPDCAVCALRKRYFEPEFNLEKRFQQKMKSKKFKAHLSRIIFKQASTVDKLLENRARQQHELAMENLCRERLVKIDRMYCLLETRLYLSN